MLTETQNLAKRVVNLANKGEPIIVPPEAPAPPKPGEGYLSQVKKAESQQARVSFSAAEKAQLKRQGFDDQLS